MLADAIRKLVGLLMLDQFVVRRNNMEAAFALLFFKQLLEGALVLVDVQVNIFRLHHLETLFLRDVPKHVKLGIVVLHFLAAGAFLISLPGVWFLLGE